MHPQDTLVQQAVHGQPPIGAGSRPSRRREHAPVQCGTHQERPNFPAVNTRPPSPEENLPRNRCRRKFPVITSGFAKVQLWSRLPWATATFRTKMGQSE